MQYFDETRLAAMVEFWSKVTVGNPTTGECTRCRAETAGANELVAFIDDMNAAHKLLEVAYEEPDEEIAALVRAAAYRIHMRAHSLLQRAAAQFAFLQDVGPAIKLAVLRPTIR